MTLRVDPGPLGRELRALREARGLGLREAAKKLALSAAYLSSIETGQLKTPPAAAALRGLAKLYEVDADRLLLLAGRLPEDVKQLLLDDPGLTRFLRAATARGLSGADLLTLLAARRRSSPP
ncbi:MAG: helix-turn-helix domain-containing protein [Myxococcota bacterium]